MDREIESHLIYIGGFSKPFYWAELYFDKEKGKFVLDEYHQGAVDHEDFYDGRRTLSTESAILKVFPENLKLIKKIVQYSDEPYDIIIKDAVSVGIEGCIKFLGDDEYKRYCKRVEEDLLVGKAEVYYETATLIGKYDSSTKAFYRYLTKKYCWVQDNDLPIKLIKEDDLRQYNDLGWKELWNKRSSINAQNRSSLLQKIKNKMKWW